MGKNPNYTTQQHREWTTMTLVKIKSDVEHIKEKVNEQEIHLSKLNGQVGKNSNAIARIQGVGSVIALVFGSVFAFLFNKN